MGLTWCWCKARGGIQPIGGRYFSRRDLWPHHPPPMTPRSLPGTLRRTAVFLVRPGGGRHLSHLPLERSQVLSGGGWEGGPAWVTGPRLPLRAAREAGRVRSAASGVRGLCASWEWERWLCPVGTTGTEGAAVTTPSRSATWTPEEVVNSLSWKSLELQAQSCANASARLGRTLECTVSVAGV